MLIKKQLLFKQADPTEGDEEKYIIRGVFSTDDLDRHDEKIIQGGWKLAEYKVNPVILFGHDQGIPAVGKAIELSIDSNGQLSGAIQFAVEEHELAKTLYKLYKGGFMRAFSVGFRNDVYEVDRENEIVILKENTLFEISCVNVPANSMALASSKGIDTKSLERLGELKEADEKKEEEKIVNQIFEKISEKIRNDNRIVNLKAETRSATGAKFNAKTINKAVRHLLNAKKKIKN